MLFQCRIDRLIRGILDCFTAHGARVKGGTRLIVVVVVVIVIVTEQEQWSSIDGACPVVAVKVCSAHGRVGCSVCVCVEKDAFEGGLRSCTSTLRVGEVVLILYLANLVLVPLLSCVDEFYTFPY